MVRYGDILKAPHLAKMIHKESHLVTSFDISIMKFLFRNTDEIIVAGVTTEGKFTIDLRPIDYKNVKCSSSEKLVFSKIIYADQKRYEVQLQKVGLKIPMPLLALHICLK